MSVEGILISSLDTFTGTPSNTDYLAIDNGTATKKVSATELLSNAVSFADSDADGNVVISMI